MILAHGIPETKGAVTARPHAQPDEIGSVVGFLAGDDASCVTATTALADGGIMRSGPGL